MFLEIKHFSQIGPETLTSERDEQNNTVNSIRQQIESLEASIRRCQDLIRDSEATVAREQEKLRANEKDRETLRTLLSQLDKKRAELKVIVNYGIEIQINF